MPRAYRESRAIARARTLARDLIAQLEEIEAYGLDVEFDPTPLPEPDVDLVVLSYQYRENYAFDADGHLIEDRSYWKSKGGDEVIVRIPDGWTIADVRESLKARFEWDNPASEQYFLGCYRASAVEVCDSDFLVECGVWVPTAALTC